MDVRIYVSGGDAEYTAALAHWLNDESELRGAVRQVAAPIVDTELGSVAYTLTVALGAGGGGTVLARSLTVWLQTRRTSAKLTVECEGRTVTLDLKSTHDMQPLLRQVLKVPDETLR